jgi:hypothetical protein
MSASSTRHESKRAELVRRLVELSPKRRADALLEEVDGQALVRSIPAEDVYAIVLDVGLPDSTELVQLATPEQFRTFVDLAAWQKDQIDVLEVLRWLRAARGGNRRGRARPAHRPPARKRPYWSNTRSATRSR